MTNRDLSGLDLPGLAQPHLEQLVAPAGESATLWVPDGDHVVCVARVPAPRVMAATIAVGARLPAPGTGAAGRWPG